MVPLARSHSRADRSHDRGGGSCLRQPRSDGPGTVSSGALERLEGLLRGHGGLIATLVGPPSAGSRGPNGQVGDVTARGPAQLAAAGPRAAGSSEEYELLVEAI